MTRRRALELQQGLAERWPNENFKLKFGAIEEYYVEWSVKVSDRFTAWFQVWIYGKATTSYQVFTLSQANTAHDNKWQTRGARLTVEAVCNLLEEYYDELRY